jgi:hypothetical protein
MMSFQYWLGGKCENTYWLLSGLILYVSRECDIY